MPCLLIRWPTQIFRAHLGALYRPAIIPAPGSALRLLYGAMADETILSNIGAIPAILQESGFQFKIPHIQQALIQTLV